QDADTKPRSRGSPAWAQGELPEVPTDPAQQAQYINSVAAACPQNGPDDARQIARRDGVEMPRAAFEGLDNFKACMDGANLWLKNTSPCMTRSDRDRIRRHYMRQYRRCGILAFGKRPHRVAAGKNTS